MTKITIERVRVGTKRHDGFSVFLAAHAAEGATPDTIVAAIQAKMGFDVTEGRRWYNWIVENCSASNGDSLGEKVAWPRSAKATASAASPAPSVQIDAAALTSDLKPASEPVEEKNEERTPDEVADAAFEELERLTAPEPDRPIA